MRDDEPRRVWMSPLITHGTCVCVYYCRTYDKAVRGGEEDMWTPAF